MWLAFRDLFPVKIKDEEEYEQVLVADPQSRGAPECSQDAIAPPLDCSKPYCVQMVYGDLLTDPGETLSNTKTQCSSPGAEKECYSPKAKRRRGSGSQMGITVTECNEESEGEEVSNVLYECQPQYDEHAVSEDLYSIDQQRTLGEILSYCQIMYEAIQKLDQKFDQLQAKVMNVSAVDLNPVLFRQKPQLPASNGHPQVRTETSPVSDGSLPMPQLMPVCSPSPPPQGEGKKPPPLSPAPRVPSPPPLLHQQGQQSRPGQATVSAQGTPSTRRATGSLKNTPPAAENTGAKGSRKSPSGAPPNTKTELIGDPRRQVRIPSSVLQKVSNKKNPRNMVRFLLRGLFSVETLTSSNIMGDSVRGLKKLDPNKIAAMREWLSKKFTRYDLRENGRDWRACISIMNSTARYLRFEAKKNKHKQQNEKFKEGPPDKDEREAPALEETAEIDVELESDSEGGSPSISCKSSTSQVHQRALDSSSRLNQKKDKTESEETLEFLGDPSRQVMVPQYALLTARLRTRPELAARFLIKYLFPYDLLVKSNVYGNRERGILALDRNRISALREHLKEQYPWFLLEEDGQDWKACVGAINSTIRKFRHELKKGKMVK
ncbi:BEN domain-containing protein 2 isoform X2 [Lepisosteus oculatus]|uniref:BEN domain-containing protein 2 isoform X2 n=1 Tax=Lepisosteus oculatus TaxID=7918 RepID=UPI0007401F0B|nr:PREDICTED: BEN domain-containing protein 2 isoform X2 [Lepisosteus oculatus]